MKKLIVAVLLVFSFHSNNASAAGDPDSQIDGLGEALVCSVSMLGVSAIASATGTYFLLDNFLPMDDGNLKGGILAISMILNGLLGGYYLGGISTFVCFNHFVNDD